MDGLQEALDRLATGQEQEIYKAKLTLQQLIGSATKPGNEAERAKLATSLAQAFINGGKYGVPARAEIARRLGEVGGDVEVTVLKSAMIDLELRESARFALDRIPSADATAALIEAARNAIGSRFRLGLMNALGQRQGKGVVEALVEGTKENDVEVRLAAVEALAEHPEEESDAAMAAVLVDSAVPLDARGAARVAKARLRLARHLVAANQAAAAKKIYQGVLDSKPPAAQAKVAQAGLQAIG